MQWVGFISSSERISRKILLRLACQEKGSGWVISNELQISCHRRFCLHIHRTECIVFLSAISRVMFSRSELGWVFSSKGVPTSFNPSDTTNTRNTARPLATPWRINQSNSGILHGGELWRCKCKWAETRVSTNETKCQWIVDWKKKGGIAKTIPKRDIFKEQLLMWLNDERVVVSWIWRRY